MASRVHHREIGRADHCFDLLLAVLAPTQGPNLPAGQPTFISDDFEFGDVQCVGSYSTMRLKFLPCLHPAHHMSCRATRHEYTIKVLDKGRLKLRTALAWKNTFVRPGSGRPGIVRLHWAFWG
jgi:3-phosphoinositide dependent protein kinase-1